MAFRGEQRENQSSPTVYKGGGGIIENPLPVNCQFRQKFALVKVRIKNKGERKRKRSLSIKAISQIAASPNTPVTQKQI